jgi:hypothetical protein
MDAGMCENCRHVRRLSNARGSVFYLCERAVSDARFARYPRLPMLRCDGHEPPSDTDSKRENVREKPA